MPLTLRVELRESCRMSFNQDDPQRMGPGHTPSSQHLTPWPKRGPLCLSHQEFISVVWQLLWPELLPPGPSVQGGPPCRQGHASLWDSEAEATLSLPSFVTGALTFQVKFEDLARPSPLLAASPGSREACLETRSFCLEAPPPCEHCRYFQNGWLAWSTWYLSKLIIFWSVLSCPVPSEAGGTWSRLGKPSLSPPSAALSPGSPSQSVVPAGAGSASCQGRRTESLWSHQVSPSWATAQGPGACPGAHFPCHWTPLLLATAACKMHTGRGRQFEPRHGPPCRMVRWGLGCSGHSGPPENRASLQGRCRRFLERHFLLGPWDSLCPVTQQWFLFV